MNPILVIGVPPGLVIVGMILNSWDFGFAQPPSSPEQDTVNKLVAAAPEAPVKEKVSSWEIERLGAAISTGDNALPLVSC